MERWHAKAITGVVMFISILFCFLLPIKLSVFFRKKGDRGQYYLDILACFAGGVFLAVYLIFMAPAARDLILENLMIPNKIDYPIPDVLIGAGFFIMLMINRFAVSCNYLTRKNKRKKVLNVTADLRHSESGTNSVANSSKPSSDNFDLADNHEIIATEIPSDSANPYPLARRSSITDVAHQETVVRSLVMMLALSLDSVFEGLTTGLKTTIIEVWAIFIGNMVHETVIAFCLGLQLIKTHEDRKMNVVWAALLYSLMNPVGLLVATVFYETKGAGSNLDLTSGIIQGLTSGCFIYVTFCEILEGQLTHHTSYAKILSMVIGFVIMAAFASVPGSSSYALIDHLSHGNCTSD